MKKIMKNILFGIGLGCAIFAVTGIVFDVLYSGRFLLENWSYTKMVIGSMVIGIGFFVPSMVYDSDKLPFGIQALIHMGIGCAIYIVVASLVGWIPFSLGWAKCAMIVLGQLLIAFIIWMIFVLYYKNLAKKMNGKIAGLQK